MSKEKLRTWLPVLCLMVLTGIVAAFSPLNPWGDSEFTKVQQTMLDSSQRVRDGYLAYVEIDSNSGPVLNEILALGILASSHFKTPYIINFIIEIVIIFASTLFVYKTIHLMASEWTSVVMTAVLFLWYVRMFTVAGAEEYVFPLLAASTYTLVAQIKKGYMGYMTYDMAVCMALVFFLQSNYVIIWIGYIIILCASMKVKELPKDQWKRLWMSILEGIGTVTIPMAIYLWYFDNIKEFFDSVVLFRLEDIKNSAASHSINAGEMLGNSMIVLLAVYVVLMLYKGIKGKMESENQVWLVIMALILITTSFQSDHLESFQLLAKVIYIMPLAMVAECIDELINLNKKRKHVNKYL